MPTPSNDKPGRPSFPQLSLRKALQLVSKVFEREPGTHAIPEDSFLKLLGSNKATGGTIRIVASLKGYDLISRRKGGYSLTDRTIKLFTTNQYDIFESIIIEISELPKVLKELSDLFPNNFYSTDMQEELSRRGFIDRGSATIKNVLKDNWSLVHGNNSIRSLFNEIHSEKSIIYEYSQDMSNLNNEYREILSFTTSSGSKITVLSKGNIIDKDIEKLKALLDVYRLDMDDR